MILWVKFRFRSRGFAPRATAEVVVLAWGGGTPLWRGSGCANAVKE